MSMTGASYPYRGQTQHGQDRNGKCSAGNGKYGDKYGSNNGKHMEPMARN